MDIKSATKVVNKELKKLKDIISDWHVKREEVFISLQTSWKNTHKETIDELKEKKVAKDVVIGLKNFEKFNNKIFASSANKIIAINSEYSLKTKELSKELGNLADPYLQTIKYATFGTDEKAVEATLEDFQDWINSECLEEFEPYDLSKKLKGKLTLVIKEFSKKSENDSEENHKKYMAKMEFFGNTMLNNLKKPLSFSKVTINSLKDNFLLHNMLYQVEAIVSFQKMDQAIHSVSLLRDSVSIDSLVDSYGTAFDEKSLKRSKSAMTGVKKSLVDFLSYFEESFVDDISNNMSDMNKMYLNDMMDHLNLGKACLINDVVRMAEANDMDTAPRELISQSLYEYINSENFYVELKSQKKLNKKSL